LVFEAVGLGPLFGFYGEEIGSDLVWPCPESVGGLVLSVRHSAVADLRVGGAGCCWSFNCESGSGAPLGVPRSASLTGCLHASAAPRPRRIRSEAFKS
jgi:hypothetical protein